MLLGKNKEISYSPGRLSRRLGISRMSLMNHLNETGLIHRCYRDDNGWWRIPYRIAIEVAGPEALAVELPKGKPRGRTAKKRKSSETDDWNDLVDELMERKKPLRQPPTNSISERAKRLVEEKLQYDLNRAMQLLQAGVTPQMYAEEVKRYREGKNHNPARSDLSACNAQAGVESSSDLSAVPAQVDAFFNKEGSEDKDKQRGNKEDLSAPACDEGRQVRNTQVDKGEETTETAKKEE